MSFRLVILALGVVLLVGASGAPVDDQDANETYRWCVPEELRNNCSLLTNAAGVPIVCVGGVDRMDCLQKVRNRQADYLMADPEDLYVAMHMENQDFVVFAEQRSLEEPTAPFRYEGIMLVRSADGFQSLSDLRGKKSCHTGFGRNVGYKIPVARLQKAGLLKLPGANDGALSSVERELSALSELFSASCLPGSYSPHADIDRLLKQRYANLCERCDAPAQCSKQDKYGGYEGAIRCLVENGGDVAFTKTIFVRKYFGLPVTPGGTAKPPLNPAARSEDYVYLCEDGSTRPIAEGTPPCSWAQRPWQVLLGNGDIRGHSAHKLQTLTAQLQRYYTEATSDVSQIDRAAAITLRINPATPLVIRNQPVSPSEYLQSANYIEVIEREGPKRSAIFMCVTSESERQKCEVMRQAAYSRDIRPAFHCLLKTEDACIAAVQNGQEANVVVLKKQISQLKPIMSEVYTETTASKGDNKGDTSTRATVYVRPDMDEAVQDSIVHAFTALSEAFGAGKSNAQVFRMFGPFPLKDQKNPGRNLIFNDIAIGLMALGKTP